MYGLCCLMGVTRSRQPTICLHLRCSILLLLPLVGWLGMCGNEFGRSILPKKSSTSFGERLRTHCPLSTTWYGGKSQWARLVHSVMITRRRFFTRYGFVTMQRQFGSHVSVSHNCTRGCLDLSWISLKLCWSSVLPSTWLSSPQLHGVYGSTETGFVSINQRGHFMRSTNVRRRW